MFVRRAHKYYTRRIRGQIPYYEEYIRLGKNSALRQKTYRDLFKESLDAKIISDLRKGAQSGKPVGYKNLHRKLNSY